MIGNLEVNGLSFRLMDELPKHYDKVTPQDFTTNCQYLFCQSQSE